MDLATVRSVRIARDRRDLRLAPGEAFLAGGTWLYSQPQPQVRGVVDLLGLGWPAVERSEAGLSIAATCTIAELLSAMPDGGPDRASALFGQCARGFLMSFKIWNSATVGGNLVMALPAGAMISLTAGLGAEVVIWTPAGQEWRERREPVVEFVRDDGLTSLQPGEVLRSIEVPASALAAHCTMRRLSLSAEGRSSAVVVGRHDENNRVVLTITASTRRPIPLEFEHPPSAGQVRAAVHGVQDWFEDLHGAADWRAAITETLAVEVAAELAQETA